MTIPTGFSDVDRSARPSELVDYLTLVAGHLAGMRSEDYEMLRLRPGAAVLDVGCGAGEVCLDLATRVGRRGTVAGIDPSAAMIEAAKRAAETSGAAVDLRVASIYALPFPDDTFDAVRAERVFQHLDDPEAGLREMLRVTRAGGRVMVMDPDHSQAGMGLDDAGERRVFAACLRALARMLANPHSGTRLRAMFVRAGLADIGQVVRSVELTHSDYVRTLFLRERLASAVEADEITDEEARDFSAALEERRRAGTFFTNVIAYSVSGTKT